MRSPKLRPKSPFWRRGIDGELHHLSCHHDRFLHASYLVVATPTQDQPRLDDQRVVGVLSRDVMAEHGIGASFQRLPGEFMLDNGVIGSVYEKIRPFEHADLVGLSDEFIRYYADRREMFMTVDR
jgi:hypothetical protein